jgi:hypothetical protein
LLAFVGPWTIPGWAVFLWSALLELLDFAHRFRFIAELIEGSPVDLLGLIHHWGWLVGAVWILAVALKVALRPDSTEEQAKEKEKAKEQEKAMQRTGKTLANAALKFDALLETRGVLLVSETQANEAILEFASALGGFAVAAYSTLPPESRQEYVNMLAGALGDLTEFQGKPFWLMASVYRAVVAGVPPKET